MKQKVKSLLSILTILLFLLFAGASEIGESEPITCNWLRIIDKQYRYECEPLDETVTTQLIYQLKLKDRSTGEALSGISYSELNLLNEMVYEYCVDELENERCYAYTRVNFDMDHNYYAGNVSDESGLITNIRLLEFDFADKNDRFLYKVLITDNNNVYAPKTVYLRYFYNSSPSVQDVYLINNNEL